MTKENMITLLNGMIEECQENKEYFEKEGNLEIASFNIGVAFGCKYAKALLKELEER